MSTGEQTGTAKQAGGLADRIPSEARIRNTEGKEAKWRGRERNGKEEVMQEDSTNINVCVVGLQQIFHRSQLFILFNRGLN